MTKSEGDPGSNRADFPLLGILGEVIAYIPRLIEHKIRGWQENRRWNKLSNGQQWGHYYNVLTEADIKSIDENKLSDDAVQALIRERKSSQGSVMKLD